MTIQLNGARKEINDHLTVEALVQQLGLQADRVAVELNLEILSRKRWPETTLREGDRIEMVHFVGGG